jgi:radical SAM protein with 4Fe4S-binding SPASM domain
MKDNILLRGWTEPDPNLQYCLYDWHCDRLYEIEEEAQRILCLCNGITPLDVIHRSSSSSQRIISELHSEGVIELNGFQKKIDDRNTHRKATNPLLRNVCWLITGKCNFACKHCYMDAPANRWGELEFDNVKKIVEEIVNANGLSVVLTGGEPLYRGDIHDIIELLTTNKIRIRGINTNGSLLSDDIISKILQCGIKPDISVSFDGQAYHKLMRSLDDSREAKIKKNIEKVIQAGLRVSINTCVTNANKSSLVDDYELWRDTGIHAWRLNTPSKMGQWSKNFNTDEISVDDEADLYRQIFEKWLENDKPFHLSLGNLFRSGKCSGDDPMNEVPDIYDLNTSVCNYYKDEVVILPNGDVVACNAFMNIPGLNSMGNVLEKSLSVIWSSERMRNIKNISVKDLLSKEENRECESCNKLSICGLGCRVTAYTETGNFLSKDPRMCTITKKYYARFAEHDRK